MLDYFALLMEKLKEKRGRKSLAEKFSCSCVLWTVFRRWTSGMRCLVCRLGFVVFLTTLRKKLKEEKEKETFVE